TTGFDISILELLAPLCRGGEVIVADRRDLRDPERLAWLLRNHAVTSMQATPSHWSLLLEHDRTSLDGRRLLVGGEPLSAPLAACGRDVWNLYGPTEATVWASAHHVEPDSVDSADGGIVSIGRPLAGYGLYVLGPALELLPIGAAGELYIAGAALARGYLNQP